MKIYNKLFAIIIAMLGVTTLKAQTDVTSLYLTNADFETGPIDFTVAGNGTVSSTSQRIGNTGWVYTIPGWTNASVIKNNAVQIATAEYSMLKASSQGLNSSIPPTSDNNGNEGAALHMSAGWGDDAIVTQVSKTELEVGTYEFTYSVCNQHSNPGIAVNFTGVKLADGSTITSSLKTAPEGQWISETISFVISTKQTVSFNLGFTTSTSGSGNGAKLYVDNLKLTYKSFDEVTSENPADFTSLIKNPSFETNSLDGWTVGSYSSDTGVKPNSNNTYKTSGVDGNYLYNTWWQGTPLTQTVGNIPNGIYELKVLLASDQNAKLFLLANDEHSEVYTITTDNKTFHDVSYEFKVLNGQAKIGVVGGNDAGEYVAAGHWWYKADNFRLIYKGADLSIEREALNAALAKARAIDQATIPAVVAVSLNSAISTAENVENALNPIKAATNALLAVLATVDVVQAPYIETKDLITSSNNMLTNSTASDADKATFQGVINKAEENLNDATEKATIDAIAVTIMDAQKAYCLVASPTEGHPFNMTHLIVNPNFDQDKTGWNSDGGAQNKAIASNKPEPITGKFYENWNPSNFTGAIYQEISGLPNGTYKLKAAAFGNNAVLFANDATTQMADNDNTPAWYEVEVKVSGGTLKFGVRNNNNTGWMGIDNVSLLFISGFDLSEFIASYEAALANAIASRDNVEYKNIIGIERTNLESAINNAVADETKEAYMDAILVLETAIAAFTNSKADYDVLAGEIEVAKGLGMTEQQIVNVVGMLTGAKTLPALRVAEYNYVTEEFSYPVELSGDWTTSGPVGELSDQHWSGEKRPYMEQSGAAWGSNAWEISYDQDLTLPAGEYVFKVAGRKASGTGCTLELIVTKEGTTLGTVNDFPEGDTGLGINKNGVTSFDANDEAGFANNNAGRAWQWRYVKFTLGEAATVNIAVKAEATTNHQWISFCDATVQMTEETYLEANKGGLDAPTAAANALVDTKPMGTAENEALEAALALPVTTGAELKTKIDAINTAVANAKEWVAAYNVAKAPLVAALERFETDYNKDGVKMSQTVWNNILDEVKDAAVAKDVTDSYDGFAVAAEELNAALDAAQASIDAYAALNEVIENANTTANGGNIGDQPFQRPVSAQTALEDAIATAQTAYDKAEADATEVKNTLATAVEAFNNAELNKPEADEAFNIVLVYANYKFDGKAMTYIANDRKDHGLYNIKYKAEPNANYAQAFTLTPITDKVNHYTLSMTDVDGNERYVCTGTVYGGNASQIRTTTDASKALAVKVIATSTDDIWNLQNTEANNYIGSQDEGVFTVNSHIDFNIVKAEKADVTLSISEAGWATLILPFNAEIPEGVTVYASEKLNDESVALKEVESIVANTPYLISGTEGTYKFSGYGLAYKNSYEDENELFVGTYVDYTTVGGEYVLQKHGDVVAFYCVGESAKPTVKAYRCYLTAPASGIKAFFFGDEVTGINGVDTADAEIEAIYTINGTRVNNLQKGLNIVKMSNGKTQKVYVK